jgi:hypothetical protein
LTKSKLVEGAINGDEDAFEELLNVLVYFQVTRSSKLQSPEVLSSCDMLELRNVYSYNQCLRSNLSNLFILVIIQLEGLLVDMICPFCWPAQDTHIIPRGYFFVQTLFSFITGMLPVY